MMVVGLFVLPTILFQQNCAPPSPNFKENPEQIEEVHSETVTDEVVPEIPPIQQPEKSCSPPNPADTRGDIASGSGRMYFETIVGGPYCNKVQFRGCSDGNLSGNFSSVSCSIVLKTGAGTFLGCQTPIGTIDHGASVMLFSDAVDANCSAQIKTCNDGVLTGDSAYNKPSCRLSSALAGGSSCSVNWNGTTIAVPHNSRLLGFMSEKANTESGANCGLSTARCNNGALVGNASLASSCREKRIEEMPDGSLITGHDLNSSKVFIAYRVSNQSAGSSCSLEFKNNGSWLPISSSVVSFDCASLSAGSILKTTIDLATISNFAWTETLTAGGSTEYRSKIRIKFNSQATEPNKDLLCIKKGTDILGATPNIDENCDGQF